jgi:hypothetical protein
MASENLIPRTKLRNNMSYGVVDKKFGTYYIDNIKRENFVAECVSLHNSVRLASKILKRNCSGSVFQNGMKYKYIRK